MFDAEAWMSEDAKYLASTPSTFSPQQIYETFHLDKDQMTPSDTLLDCNTLLAANGLFQNTSVHGEHLFGDPSVRMAALLELTSILDAAVIFDRIVLPLRKAKFFDFHYTNGPLTKLLADEGILKVTFIDDVHSTHPGIYEMQKEMHNAFFEDQIDGEGQVLLRVQAAQVGNLHQWVEAIACLQNSNPFWLVGDYMDMHGLWGDHSTGEEIFLSAILMFSVAKMVGFSVQPSILTYPVRNIVLQETNHFRLPDAYARLASKQRAEGFGKYGLEANLSIPPIAAYVLDKGFDVSAIAKRLLRMRSRFRGFRQRFAEYGYIISHEEEFCPDRLEDYRKRYWEKLCQDIDSVGSKRKSFLHLADPLAATIGTEFNDGNIQMSFSIGGLVEALQNGFSLLSWSCQPRLLTDLYRSAQHLPIDMGKEIGIGRRQDMNSIREFFRKYTKYVESTQQLNSFMFPSLDPSSQYVES